MEKQQPKQLTELGVKVWVFKGEIMAHDPMAQDKRMAELQPASVQR